MSKNNLDEIEFVPAEIEYIEVGGQKKGANTKVVVVDVEHLADELRIAAVKTNNPASKESKALVEELEKNIRIDLNTGGNQALDKFVTSLNSNGNLTPLEIKTIKKTLEPTVDSFKTQIGAKFTELNPFTKGQNISLFKEKIARLTDSIATPTPQEEKSSMRELQFVENLKDKLHEAKETGFSSSKENKALEEPKTLSVTQLSNKLLKYIKQDIKEETEALKSMSFDDDIDFDAAERGRGEKNYSPKLESFVAGISATNPGMSIEQLNELKENISKDYDAMKMALIVNPNADLTKSQNMDNIRRSLTESLGSESTTKITEKSSKTLNANAIRNTLEKSGDTGSLTISSVASSKTKSQGRVF